MTKEIQAPSRLIVHPNSMIRDEAMHQQPTTSPSVTIPAWSSEKSAPLFSRVPQSNSIVAVGTTNHQRQQQTLASKAPVPTQSFKPSLAAGGVHSNENQPPGLLKSQSNSNNVPGTTDYQRLPQALTFKEAMLTQSPNSSVAAGGFHTAESHAPSSSKVRILQTMAPATSIRPAQAPLTIALRETVQSPQETIKLTVPPHDGAKQTQAPSRLIVR